MSNRFVYCTLAELIADIKGTTGLPVDALARFIHPACDYITQEIGQFLPVAATLNIMPGEDARTLFVPPLLALTGDVLNGSTVLVSADYDLRGSAVSDAPCWGDGPYTQLWAGPDSSISEWDDDYGVQVPGLWGLYNRALATGATLAAKQLVGDLSFSVADGSLISPGMVLKIENEMQYVTGYGAPTAAVTTLNGALDASEETFNVVNGALLKAGEVIRVNFERMLVLEVQTNAVNVARSWAGSKRVSHLTAANVDVYRTFAVERAINGTTAAEHASATAISRYVAPESINLLARKMAALMLKQSETGYSGAVGNTETGQTFYINIFPREDLERIKNVYNIPAAR